MSDDKPLEAEFEEVKTPTVLEEKLTLELSQIIEPSNFREVEKLASEVFKIRDQVLVGNIDVMPEGQLLRYGGKLAGYMFSLGTRVSYERAKRDLFRSNLKKYEAERLVEVYQKSDSKVTLAKAIIKKEISELERKVILQDQVKNNFEHLLEATRIMVMFIQSVISARKSERFISGQSHDNN